MKRYQVLYTHQKTKKSKIWQDGVLCEVNNTKLSLLAENGRYLESVFMKANTIEIGEEIESDAYLILIDSIAKENEQPGAQQPPSHVSRPLRQLQPQFSGLSRDTEQPKGVARRFLPPLMKQPQEGAGRLQCEQVHQSGVVKTANKSRDYQTANQNTANIRQPAHIQPAVYSIPDSANKNVPWTGLTSNRNSNLLDVLEMPQSRRLETSQTSDLLEMPQSRRLETSQISDLLEMPQSRRLETSQISDLLEMPQSRRLETSQISDLLEMPQSRRLETSQTSREWNFRNSGSLPATPVPQEQRSIDSIFRVLNGIDSSSRAVSAECGESCSSTFDCFDETIFSPSPPKLIGKRNEQSRDSQQSRDTGQSSSSSIGNFIDEKIDNCIASSETTNTSRYEPSESTVSAVYEVPIKSNCVLKPNPSTKSSSPRNVPPRNVPPCNVPPRNEPSIYQTVDYFHIFGDHLVDPEQFQPAVLEQDMMEPSAEKSSAPACNDPVGSASGETLSVVPDNGSVECVDEVLEAATGRIPACDMWQTGSIVEVRSEQCTVEQTNKRRKLGDDLGKPR